MHFWIPFLFHSFTLWPFPHNSCSFSSPSLHFTSSLLFLVRCSAHYSLSHLRINVLHLPAYTQICLHWHAAQPSIGPRSLWLWNWLWGWRRTWREWGAGPASPGAHIWTALWVRTWRWPCMVVQTWKCVFCCYPQLSLERNNSQPWLSLAIMQLIPLHCLLCLCCDLIPSNVHWTH